MTRAELLPHAPDEDTARLATQARRVFWWRALAVVIDSVMLALVDFATNGIFGVTHVTRRPTALHLAAAPPPSPAPRT